MVDITKDQVIEWLSNQTVLEISGLVSELEKKWGVSSVLTPMTAGNIDDGSVKNDKSVEEKTEFDVILTSYGERKINAIKVIREITGLGLQEAKTLVESAPKAVKENISKDEASEIKKKIEQAGAKAEIK